MMKALGQYVREEREKQGYTPEDVAEATNIRVQYINAIEEEHFDVFPAPVYAKGFIRSYAQFLKLDPEALVVEYELNFERPNARQEDVSSSGRSKVYWLSLGVATALAAFVIMFRFAWVYPEETQQVSRSPRAPVEKTYASSPVSSLPAQPESRHVTQLQDRAVAEVPDRLEVTVEAVEKTWLYVIFDGITKREMMLQKGESVSWEAKDTIRLRLGNAGGIRVYYRGEPLPKFGESGQVTDKILTLQNGHLEVRSVGFKNSSTAP